MNEICETYVVRDQVELRDLFVGMAGRYALQAEAAENSSVVYVDTFDWRLYDKGFTCQYVEHGGYFLRDFSGEHMLLVAGKLRKRLLPTDLVDSPLSEKLQHLAGVRALLPQVELNRRTVRFRLLNEDEKTVVSGWLEQNFIQGEEAVLLPGSLCLRGLRGYEKALEYVRELLLKHGVEAGCPERMIVDHALAAAGKKPATPHSQFTLILYPEESVAMAARKIFLHLAEEMESNIAGILDDLDSEFLHDFRVALRRSRSLLGSIKKILPPDDLVMLQSDLQQTGLATGPVRDLDVYLLARQTYLAMLPETLREGLELFFQGLARQRVKERKKLKRFLLSSNYTQRAARWRKYVEDSLLVNVLEPGTLPCREVAVKAIRKRVKMILREGALIGPQSPDSALHSLRIQAKKLRYLLEFYRSLFSAEEIDTLIKSLKKVQDNLGSFNDLSVQQIVLLHYQQELLSSRDQHKAVQIAAALGGLVTRLSQEQKEVREKFELTFSQFGTEENRNLIAQIFQG